MPCLPWIDLRFQLKFKLENDSASSREIKVIWIQLKFVGNQRCQRWKTWWVRWKNTWSSNKNK